MMTDSELLLGALKLIGWLLAAVILIVLLTLPNSIGKLAEIWRFFRGE